MNRFLYIALIGILALSPAAAGPHAGSPDTAGVSGAFIQFNRADAKRPVDQWQAMLGRMQAVGINTLVIQWTAAAAVLYFKDKDLDFKEQHDTLERLLQAAGGMNFSIFLGLQSDPSFWKEITARDKALRDYFLVRLAQNERLQQALLKTFKKQTNWTGYYIPDEIDDLSWRDPARGLLLKNYLRQTIQSLRRCDPDRPIAISAFGRVRTAPTLAAATLDGLTEGIGLDYLLIQDGAGGGDPPDDVLPLYYQALLNCRRGRAPERWAVLEAFRQTSGNTEPFAAKPAPADDFGRQIRAAAGFKRRILFSFPEYADPERGAEAKALYQSLIP